VKEAATRMVKRFVASGALINCRKWEYKAKDFFVNNRNCPMGSTHNFSSKAEK
jgi:hypothetical protein